MENQPCDFNIHIPSDCKTIEVYVVFETDEGFYKSFPLSKRETRECYDIFGGQIAICDTGLYFYHFEVKTEGSDFELFKEGTKDTNIGAGEKWQLTCYKKGYDTPDWSKGAVYYQIFPDRFNIEGDCDLSEKLEPFTIHENTDDCPNYLPIDGEILNNDFFGGTLKGIEKKLPYLNDMGVNIIYLNPIFKGFLNHRYDTCDYKKIDPMLGTEEDFVSLCDSAHKMGMKIILDGVFSHTGSDSIYFDKKNCYGTGAYNNENSRYKSWYKFVSYPEKYDCWWGITTLPAIDKTNEDYISYIIEEKDSVIEYWLNKGADGYRLDVADELGSEFIERLSRKVKEVKKDAIVMGEVWEDASNKESYGKRQKYLQGSQLDSVMNYPFKNAIINLLLGNTSIKGFKNIVMTICENYPKPVLDSVMNLLSTHDTPRILTILGEADFGMSKEQKASYKLTGEKLSIAYDRLFCALFLEFTLPGAPCIYYGDETGMEGFEDPFNRRFFDWSATNGMLFDFCKSLASLKNSEKSLKIGDIEFSDEENVVRFRRGDVWCLLNLGKKPVEVEGEILISKNLENYETKSYVSEFGFCAYR